MKMIHWLKQWDFGNYYSRVEVVIVSLLALLFIDTILGGPVGIFFRGERHLILLFILLASLFLGKKISQSSSKQPLSYKAYFLWPLWFFLASLIWVFVMPAIAGGRIEYALRDAESLVVLPIASLIVYLMQGIKYTEILFKIVLLFSVILALCQVGLWTWLEFFPTAPESYYPYIEAIFKNRDSVSIFWQPSPTGGYVRVFWISSIWLVLAVFVAAAIVTSKKLLLFIEFLLGFAICVTYTRGLWLGVGAGMLFCTAMNYGVVLLKKPVPVVQSWRAVLIGIFCATITFSSVDYLARGQAGLAARLYATTEAGAIMEPSLAERAIQVRLLMDKWKERPWMGFGYGAYLPNHMRNASCPYSYEMLPFALLMKLGIVGLGLLVAAIAGLLLSVIGGVGGLGNKLMFCGATISFFLAANTNPILYSFVGMTVTLFILLWWADLISKDNGVPFDLEVIGRNALTK